MTVKYDDTLRRIIILKNIIASGIFFSFLFRFFVDSYEITQ